ncbi:MAG: TIGR00282 family metallophosphoesterase [Treponema sp.]|nr:MAG: TIGR00282 family metallophosphoesterase [Treponema sp.]
MKNDSSIRVFIGGDVFGSVGLSCVQSLLPSLISEKSIDVTVLNAENTTGGTGVSADDAAALFDSGADILTGGNHSFEKRDFWPVLSSDSRILRPANYPDSADDAYALPGSGSCVIEKNGVRIAVLNLQGREDMPAIDCPFRKADSLVSSWLAEKNPPVILVDFHAESTMEKEALALFLDGRVSVVAGTHTHVQTADERILPSGTGYITDLGMTGPVRSVIGVDPALVIKRNITQVLYRMEGASGPAALRGLIVDIDLETHKAVSVTRIDLAAQRQE